MSESSPKPETPRPASETPLSILIVDDDEAFAALEEEYLKESLPGAMLSRVTTEASFSRALAQPRVDIAIVDHDLGWSKGLDVLARLRSKHRSCGVVMFTAQSEAALAVEGMKAGLDDYLLKAPGALAELPGIVRRVAEKAQRRREAEDEGLKTRDRFMSVALHSAIPNEQLRLWFQPILSSATGRITGLEALVRWANSEHGLVLPGDFLALAERAGLMFSIESWVLKTACRQLKEWHEAGYRDLTVAVNMSSYQFHQTGLAQEIAKTLEDTGADPAFLEIEITENNAIKNVEATTRAIHELKKMGIRVSLDDFGTGYSSLAHLRRLPIHGIKIDRSFTQGITSNPHDTAIVLAVINLAHALQKEVTAEGVETKEQFGILKAAGCEHLQGYFFSRPVPLESVVPLLEQNLADPVAGAAPTG